MKKILAEFIGTFLLVFLGTGAIVLDNAYPGNLGGFGISLTFGLSVTLMIFIFGKTSGAHINPAVTIAFSFTSLFDKKDLLPYIIAQVSGALSASFLIRQFFPLDEKLGATLPSGTLQQSFLLEWLLTYFLMLIILVISQHKKLNKYTAIVVGFWVGVAAYFVGPFSGASMNPARSLGPAFASGHTEHLWVYIVSPILGAILAAFTWIFIVKRST